MEAMDAGLKKETQIKKQPAKGKNNKGAGSKGRPKGSKNKNRSIPELTPYMT